MAWDKSQRLIWGMLAAAFALASASPAVAGAKPQGFEVLGAMNGSEDSAVLYEPNSAAPADDAPARPDLTVDTVAFDRKLPAGSILVRTSERKLYYALGNGRALRYPIGVGREGFTWSGRNRVSRKAEWPQWRPPQEMIEREAKKGIFLPSMMEGGLKNPLGARALYIGSTMYRIHGTTQPWSIGRAVSSGCIRLLNEHVIDLYNRVTPGAIVVVEG